MSGTLTSHFLRLYLEDLNASYKLDTSGNFLGTDYATLTPYTAELYYGVDANIWANTFRFYTTASCIDDGAMLFTERDERILGLNTATANQYDASGLYHIYPLPGIPPYEHYKMYDMSLNGCGVAAEDFLKELSRAVFGSPEASDLFNNQEQVENSYGTAVDHCSEQVSLNFHTKSNVANVNEIGTIPAKSTNNLKTAKRIWKQLFYGPNTRERFEMAFGATVDAGTFADGTLTDFVIKKKTGPSTYTDTHATASISKNTNAITGAVTLSIAINTPDTVTVLSVANGDELKFEHTSGVIVKIASINYVQAAMVNGTLYSPLGTPFPLRVGDEFMIKYTIQSHDDQEDASGDNLLLNNNQVNQHVKVHIKLLDTPVV